MHTPDVTEENIVRLAELFPNCVTETKDAKGNLNRAIDFDQLRQELSGTIVEGPHERYHLDWPGKREALLIANAPIAKTLRPSREESVDFDTTKNLYIEGDNLDALKLLQETYLGKVKMIYIDPPYNTGNDFIYEDDFAEDKDAYFQRSMQIDEEGNRLVANAESNGRFHSDWLTMIYSRLKLARNLLRDDGAIFISIDDHEVENLKRICSEIFGSENFVSQVTTVSNPRGRQSDTFLATVHEYVLIWAKNFNQCVITGTGLSAEQRAEFNLVDDEGEYFRLLGLRQRGAASRREDRPEMFFPIYVNSETLEVSVDKQEGYESKVLPKKSTGADGRWSWGKDKTKRDAKLLVAKMIERRGEYDIFVRDYLNRNGSERLRKLKTLWDDKGLNTQNGTQEVKAILKSDVMSYPKPLDLLKIIVGSGLSNKNDIVMDFFSGAATTAHAVMVLNATDEQNRKYILVQLPEETGREDFSTVAEIGKERIRRAGRKIKEEAGLMGAKLDIGFRVLKVDTSNMEDVYYSPDSITQDLLSEQISNVKEDRSSEDLLFQVLLDWGVDLALPITRETIAGKTIFFVDTNALAACFDVGIDEDFVKELAKRQPLRAVFRDSGFATDAVKINVEQIFKLMSPSTEVKSL